MKSLSIEASFAGEIFWLDASGALYWPAQEVLVLSDLHLEKATYLASQGSFIAPYDTLDTLERLERLLSQYQPRELILLGDSFHDRHAWTRMDDYLRTRISNLCSMVERCSWIEGNHDIGLNHDLPAFEVTREISGLRFVHDYSPHRLPQIIGHYHPKLHLSLRGRGIAGKCFVLTEQLLVMPAFGSFTGGLDIHHEAFQQLVQGAELQLYFLNRGSIVKLDRQISI